MWLKIDSYAIIRCLLFLVDQLTEWCRAEAEHGVAEGDVPMPPGDTEGAGTHHEQRNAERADAEQVGLPLRHPLQHQIAAEDQRDQEIGDAHADEAELALLAVALAEQPGIVVGGRAVRLVRPLLTLEIALAVAALSRRLARAVLGAEALQARPRLDQRAIDGEVLVGQKAPGGLSHLGVDHVMKARRFSVGKFMNVARARPLWPG